MLDETTPLYVTLGDPLTPQEVSGARYTFEHIAFTGITVLTFPGDADPDPEKDLTSMDNANELLYFKTVKRAITETYNLSNKSNPTYFVEPDYADKLYYNPEELEKNSGFITPVGTLIPNFIYVQNFGWNSLSFASNSETETETTENTATDATYDWKVEKLKVEDTPYPDDPNQEDRVNQLCNYAVEYKINSMTSYLSLLSRNPLMHKVGASYKQKFTSDFKYAGAWALLIDFATFDPVEEEFCGIKFRFYSSTEDSSDLVEFYWSPGTNAVLEINSQGGVSGPLVFSQCGLKIAHVKSESLMDNNVVFFYALMNNLVATGDLVTDSTQSSKNLICPKLQDFSISSLTQPPLNQFPTEHKKGNADQVLLDSSKCYINLGDMVECTWQNCTGSFAITPLRYTPAVKFSYFYRVAGEQEEASDLEGGSESDYFLLEIGRKSAKTNLSSSHSQSGSYVIGTKFIPHKVAYDSDSQTTIYRVDIAFYAENQYLQAYPLELFGLIHVTKHTGQLNDLLNADGDFGGDFNSNWERSLYLGYTNGVLGFNNSGQSQTWEKFITNISVSHGLEGTTGTVTLDKFLMLDLECPPDQYVGALTLVANNGYYLPQGYTMNDQEYGYHPSDNYPSLDWGQFFRGYALEVQDQVSEHSSNLVFRLVGIQRKLADMKLVNCPFWDGDQVFPEAESDSIAVLNYFISYTGCDLRFVARFSDENTAISDIILPRSWDWHAPAVNFVMGTSCLDALREIAKKINHQFIIQPDGRGYFYHLDDYGCPEWISRGEVVMDIPDSEIISMDISPYLENKYNTFMTLGALVDQDSSQGLIPANTNTFPGMLVTQNRESSFPWSRIYTHAEPGVLEMKDLERFHRNNVRFGSSDIYQGSITIPGFHGFYIYDKVKVAGETYYLTGINHNLNLQTKEWITQLSIAKFEE